MSDKQNVFKSNAVFGNRRKNFGSGKPSNRISRFYKYESWKECMTTSNEISILKIKDK